MKELRTEIEIQGSPDKVWQVLADLDQYPAWNPFIHHAVGTAKEGGKVDITVRSGSKDMTLHCTVTRAETNAELRWKYHVLLPGLFSGEHSFIIEPIGTDKVRFIDREIFNGLLIPLQARDIDTNSKRGFEEMDKALKARVEMTT
jgi:hypothetical protein